MSEVEAIGPGRRLARKLMRSAPGRIVGAFAAEYHRRNPVPPGPPPEPIWSAVQPFTLTDRVRVLALADAVRYVVRAGVPGAIVECGVWRGGSAMAVALTLEEVGTHRDLVLFDTFSGMTAPSDLDLRHDGRPASALLADPVTGPQVLAVAGLDDATRNVLSTGYDPARVRFVCGDVRETLPEQAPGQIALLRLDTDFYDSTLHELRTLVPRVSPGGVLIIDDYDHWRGSRSAVDEYFADRPILLQAIGDRTDARIAVL